MYDYDYYYKQEPSEIDCLIDDTVDKIKETILLRAKNEVDYQTQKAEKIQKQFDEYKATVQKSIDVYLNKIKELSNQLESLQKEYDKKRTEIPTLEFEVDEVVYYVDYSYENKILKCPTCNGTNKIKCHTEELGDVEVSCPHCKGNYYGDGFLREVKYNYYYPSQQRISSIGITFDHNGIHPKYYCNNSTRSIIPFKDRASCLAECNRKNAKALSEAQKHIYQGK